MGDTGYETTATYPMADTPATRETQTTRRIKALPRMARTPIIAVSSFAMKADEERARGVLTKG
jgi:CheY-like chemotaxis protein